MQEVQAVAEPVAEPAAVPDTEAVAEPAAVPEPESAATPTETASLLLALFSISAARSSNPFTGQAVKPYNSMNLSQALANTKYADSV